MQQTEKTDTVILNKRELVYLCSVIGGNSILGIDDPFIAHTEEELSHEWPELAKSLEEKNYIKTGAEGKIIVDKNVASLLWTCCEPQSYLVIDEESGSNKSKRVFYITFFMAVELFNSSEASADVFIKSVPTVLSIHSKILDFIPPAADDSVQDNSGIHITVSESSFMSILALTTESELQKYCEMIREKVPEENLSLSIVKNISSPISKISFLYLETTDSGELDGNGFTIFNGSESAWIVAPSGEQDSVIIDSYNKENVTSTIKSIMDRISGIFLFSDEDTITLMEEIFL